LTPKELRRALGKALKHSWRPGHLTNTRGRWAGAAADGICRARQVSDPFRLVARFRSHLRGPRMPVMACRPPLAVAGLRRLRQIFGTLRTRPLCNTPGVGRQTFWYCSGFTPMPRKGLEFDGLSPQPLSFRSVSPQRIRHRRRRIRRTGAFIDAHAWPPVDVQQSSHRFAVSVEPRSSSNGSNEGLHPE